MSEELAVPKYVAVVGAGVSDPVYDALAEEVGGLLADRGAICVCGGLGGVMEAACRGVKRAGGTTVGILPSSSRAEANPYIDIAIASGMGEMRNALIVRSADVVIAIGGEFGTLSEIAFALKIGRRVVGLRTWDLTKAKPNLDGIVSADSPQEAVVAALGP